MWRGGVGGRAARKMGVERNPILYTRAGGRRNFADENGLTLLGVNILVEISTQDRTHANKHSCRILNAENCVHKTGGSKPNPTHTLSRLTKLNLLTAHVWRPPVCPHGSTHTARTRCDGWSNAGHDTRLQRCARDRCQICRHAPLYVSTDCPHGQCNSGCDVATTGVLHTRLAVLSLSPTNARCCQPHATPVSKSLVPSIPCAQLSLLRPRQGSPVARHACKHEPLGREPSPPL